jgi:AcrR family transcriptional regulator
MPQDHRYEMTKERILKEAEALFAQNGFHAVSIRAITTRARCNLAAVNYHFGNKENLYLEVFRSRWVGRAMRIRKFFEKTLDAHDTPSPTAVIQALAQAFLEGPLSDEERWRHYQLISRELAHPTQAFDVISGQVMRPFFKELAGRLRPFMPEGMDEERLILNILSIFSMVLYFNFARVAITRITGNEYNQAYKARLIRHIISFSLNGLGVDEKKRV